jgi:hypothetical protein
MSSAKCRPRNGVGRVRLTVSPYQKAAGVVCNTSGLGRTGEAVIYGSDYLLRTNARGYLENPDAFLSRLKAGGFSEDTINRIRAYKTTILLLGSRFSSVTAALGGKEGHTIEKSIAGGKRLLVTF